MSWFKPKLYRVIEYDSGSTEYEYGVQYKRFGFWWNVIEYNSDAYTIRVYGNAQDALSHIDFLNSYGCGPKTRIVDKIKFN
jgi:hypothetical protein